MAIRSMLELRAKVILEDAFGLPESEYRFHPERKWRFDFAYPKYKIAVECEGAVWQQGRHTRGSGYIKDCEKYNAATVLGWKVLRYSSGTIQNVIEDIKSIVNA